ncbi:UV-B-induced protein At3g17800, chloroplastic-like [Chenopodium quinoa]|nr:UV-B-induced protein At3g17800, chloroplastic-like [Chenopodium quinoa]
MAISISQTKPNFSLLSSSSSRKPLNIISFNNRCFPVNRRRKTQVKCCLNLPLEPQSELGRSLSSVVLNQPHSFYDVVSVELNRVVEDRDAAFARFDLSLGSSEASLHRRIAKLKETECQLAVEDVLYMIILYKFSQIRVPLAPSLSECLYNGRLEILPSKDWELESIHSPEVLEMVREHLSTALGWKAGSSVAVNWSPTKIRRQHLSQIYATSILYGYFLKSASLRLDLEQSISPTYQNVPFGSWTPPEFQSYGSENVMLGQMVTPSSTTLSQVTRTPRKKEANLRCYVTGFDTLTMEHCAKLKSEESAELVDKHCRALFGNTNAENNDMILTSLSSLKRLVLEAVAFGCFLWDAEECVNRIYTLNSQG